MTHRRVAEAAGVPVGSVNHHFPSSRILVAAEVQRAEENRLTAAREVVQRLPRRHRSARSTAKVLLQTWFAPTVDSDVVRACLRPRIDALHDPYLRAAADIVRPDLLATLAEALKKSGHDAVSDLDLVAVVLDSILLYSSGVGEADDRDFAVDLVARLLNPNESRPSS